MNKELKKKTKIYTNKILYRSLKKGSFQLEKKHVLTEMFMFLIEKCKCFITFIFQIK